jgi:Phage integrase family
MKSTSKKRTPSIVNLTVKRRYLTEREVERLMDCARKHGRYGHRDATMILVAYRHGLRASEVCDLQWQQIELSEGRLHVHRVKNGIPSVHPIRGDEMRALRKLRRDYPRDAHVFVSERGGPISPIGFHRLIQRVGETAISNAGVAAVIAEHRGLEDFEQRVEIAGILATSRRGAADEVEHPAVLEAIVGEALHAAILVEIDGYDPLIDDLLRHEANWPFGALGNIVEGLTAHRRHSRGRAEHNQNLLLRGSNRDLLECSFGHDVTALIGLRQAAAEQ